MSDNNNIQTEQQPQPNPRLRSLDKLVGTWKISGPNELAGTVSFEWLEGGFFLVQQGELNQDGHKVKFVEYIGFDHGFDDMMNPTNDTSSKDITSHIYDNKGNTFCYVWEIDDQTLTIWGGEKGSPAHYKGTWGDDGNTNSGGWVYPGGGYESAMTRVK